MRRWFALRAAELLREVDVLLAPATPVPAQPLGTEWIAINGQRSPARPSLGVLTQPISCIGLPVCAVPVWSASPAHRRRKSSPRPGAKTMRCASPTRWNKRAW